MTIKSLKFQVVCSVFLLVVTSLSAQNLGHVQRGQRVYTPPPLNNTRTYIELKEVNEEVNKMLPICVSEFNLDDFEKEILKSLLTNKFESENAVLEDKKVNRDERKKRFIQIDKDFYSELSAIMTVDEMERFKVLDFEKVEKEEKKKKKKKKKRKKS